MTTNLSNETTIEHLPDEVLIKILLYLPKNDIAKCFLINRQWYKFINSCTVLMRQIPLYLSSSAQNRALEENYRFERNYRVLELIGSKFLSLNPPQFIKFETIEYLEIYLSKFGSITMFKCLLRHCKQLKYLVIGDIKIGPDDGGRDLDESCIGRTLDFVVLANFHYDPYVPLALLTAMINEKITPKVLEFQTFTEDSVSGIKNFRDIYSYLLKHYTTSLKKLLIKNRGVGNLHTAMDLLKKLDFKLRKFEIYHLESLQQFRGEAYDQFICNQTELIMFHASFSFLFDERHFQTLTSLLPNLTHLTITMTSSTMLNRCVHRLDKLKYLSLGTVMGDLNLPKNLETFHIYSDCFGRSRIKFLFNEPMMTSLQTFIILDGYIEPEEMKKFFKFCPNVQHFEAIGGKSDVLVLSKADGTEKECSLSNWKMLHTIKLDKVYLCDEILTLIESASLRKMILDLAPPDQWKFDGLQSRVQRGLVHLAVMCPRLNEIVNLYGGTIYKRNKRLSHYEIPEIINW